MPALDTATFQALILGLLLLSALTLLGILFSLRGIKKLLKRGAIHATSTPESGEERDQDFEPAVATGASGGHGSFEPDNGRAAVEAGNGRAHGQAGAAPEATASPAAVAPAAEQAQEAAPVESIASFDDVVEPHPLDTAASEQAEVAAAVEQEPQEQPFERDGRWWFRRGEELLVYDEQSGQWEPALVPQLAGAPEGALTPAAAGANAAASSGPAPVASTEAQAVENGGPWKCATCGAVNGSTSPSCRMCFSGKP